MKFLLSIFATALVIGACAKDPVTPVPPAPNPPAPIPGTTFSVNGVAIEVQGILKPGSTTTVEKAQSAVKTAVSFLEKE